MSDIVRMSKICTLINERFYLRIKLRRPIMDNLVSFKNVVKEYRIGTNIIQANHDLNFNIKSNEFVVIVGPSGAGKTTLLNLLGGMDRLTSGEIIVDGINIAGYNEKQLTKFRREHIGFVFQFYNLVPNLTAFDNIEIAAELVKNPLNTMDVLKDVGLLERKDNFPAQLSGGEQQRVSIARAIAKNPKLLLCDEPTGALDYETGKRILRLLFDISKTQKKTVIIITHNSALAKMADHVLHLKNGTIVKEFYNDSPCPIEEIEW